MSKAYHHRLARIRARYPRAYERWTPEEELKLEVMVDAREPWNVISDTLQRQPSAVRSRYGKLTDGSAKRTVSAPVEDLALVYSQEDGESEALIAATNALKVPVDDATVRIEMLYEWHQVWRHANEPYLFPRSLTPFMNHRYGQPAVYRWLISKAGSLAKPILYIGIARKLCPNRVEGYLDPGSSKTNARLNAIFSDYVRQGFEIHLEILGSREVQIDGQSRTHFGVQSETRRRTLEELLIGYYKQQGFELLNQ